MSGSQPKGDDKMKKVQSQVDEVVGIMHQNIEKVINRGDKLEELDDKTDLLQEHAHKFKSGAVRVRKQMWWNNFKIKIIIAAVVISLIIIIAVIIYMSVK